MIYLPDTNAWIRLLNPGKNLVKDRFLAADVSKIRLCSVVKAELYFGDQGHILIINYSQNIFQTNFLNSD